MDSIVVITYSFSPESRAVILPSYEDAVAFIKEDYEKELRIDKEENGYIIDSESYCEEAYAQLISGPSKGATYWSVADVDDKR